MKKINNKKIQNNFGFTLLELVVVISILSLLSVMSIVSFNDWEKEDQINSSASQLNSDIRRLQSMAFSGEKVGGIFPAGGYGIFLDESNPDFYILFADTNANFLYDSGLDIIISNVNFFVNTSLKPGGLIPDLSNKLTLVFRQPKAKVYINGSPVSPDEASIILVHSSLTKEVLIKVHRITGRVDIE